MVGVAVGDEHEIDDQRVVLAGVGKSGVRVAGEQLVVAAIDEDDPAAGRFQNEAVTLLDVHHRQPEDAVFAQPRLRADYAAGDLATRAVHGDVLNAVRLVQHLDLVAPVELGLGAVLPAEIDDVVIEIPEHRAASLLRDFPSPCRTSRSGYHRPARSPCTRP